MNTEIESARDFRSDNVASVAPAILDAIVAAGRSNAGAYGDDALSTGLDEAFSALFETPVRVFPAVTGTAANALAVSPFTPPYGVIYAAEGAHIAVDECGAPELMTGGAKVQTLPAPDGKLDPATLDAALRSAGRGEVHWPQPALLSLTQATEQGAVYGADEIAALTAVAKRHTLAVHMDGARFANAVVASGASPSALTWQAGVDVLSFGATKNGGFIAEAIVLFDLARAEDLTFRHKRAGQLLSKMRLVSAQLHAYLADGLWLALARQANAMGKRLADGLRASPHAALVGPAQANEIFATLPRRVIDGLTKEGFGFYPWPETDPATTTIRLVTRHDTAAADVDALLAAIDRLARAA